MKALVIVCNAAKHNIHFALGYVEGYRKETYIVMPLDAPRAVWSSFRSDLANQMLSLKCAETAGTFSGRRQEIVQGHIPVLVHKYRKSSDWPLAWKALQNTRDVYQKRVREFLENMYILAGHPADGIKHASTELARAIAVSLRVMPSSK